MSPHRNLVLLVALMSLLAACDNPLGADTNTFQATLQAYYDSHPVCASIPLTFPVDLRSDGDAATKQQLQPLLAAGLIAGTTVQKNETAGVAQARSVDYLRYAPTTAGEKVIRKGANSFLGGSDICFARRKVLKVESFTEPADAAGVIVSKVTYDYELKDVEPWATASDFTAAFPRFAPLLANSDNRATDVLVKTDSGWKHERDVR